MKTANVIVQRGKLVDFESLLNRNDRWFRQLATNENFAAYEVETANPENFIVWVIDQTIGNVRPILANSKPGITVEYHEMARMRWQVWSTDENGNRTMLAELQTQVAAINFAASMAVAVVAWSER